MRNRLREQILGSSAPDWFNLEDEPRATSVKAGHERTTWRVTLPGLTVYAKVQTVKGLRARIRRLLGAEAARSEWSAARTAELRGVPVARCLALGVRMRPARASVYISEEVDGACSLADAWSREVSPLTAPERRPAAHSLIEATARLYATAHARGLLPLDGHARDVLVRASSGAAPEAIFVDVHPAIRTRRAASFRCACRSLAQLDQHFHRTATRSERLSFLKSYLRHRSAILPDERGDRVNRPRGEPIRRWAARVLSDRASQAIKLAEGRDRRLARSGKYFSTLEVGDGWRAWVVLELERRHLFPEPDVPDRTSAEWAAILDAILPTRENGSADQEASRRLGVSVDVAWAGSWVRRLQWTLGGSSHRAAFHRCHKLRHRDAPAELILACAERRRAGLVDATLLIRPRRSGDSGEGRRNLTQSVGASGQASEQATRQRGNKATRQRGNKATRQEGNEAT